ncbi:unnamed protein product [Caenorhabditis angaria]|uniref:Serine/threonine-protein phosphatase n=1 Tax=Caenorhabditis angaria TaxID=860376 RepID=A0A9P1IWF8_9PELO|nr:unnamed protein product [Caenorhabditis angaria]
MVNPSKNDSKMEDTDDSFNQVYTAKELRQLIEIVVDIFKSEPTLKEVSPPCTIVGDIHGQYRDLVRILYQTTPEVEKRRSRGQDLGCSMNRFVFLGDYVDRGPNSVECICLLFSLKIIYPSQYTLLRGNHETKSINYVYGLREELMNKLDNDEGLDVWNRFNDAFALMPLAALVGTQILCMHGGISPHLQSLNDIRKIKRPLVDLRDGTLAQDLLWSDPLQFCNIHVNA